MEVHTIDLEFRATPGIIASFLIEAGDELALVEPGPESTRDTLLEMIRALGFDPDRIRSVFITHAHLDHAGAGGWWAQRGADLYVHPKAAPHLIDPSRLVASARMVFGDAFDSLWGDMLPAPEARVHALEDGAKVEIGGLAIEAIDTPGHAFHHHAFAIGDAVFAGDVAGARLEGTDYISVTSAPPQFHLESYLGSIDRLAERQFSTIYLTHFGAVKGTGEHLARYRQAVIEAAEWIRGMLEEGGDAQLIRKGYEVFQLARAREAGLPPGRWDDYQLANPTAMCADGLRMYWERKAAKETAGG